MYHPNKNKLNEIEWNKWYNIASKISANEQLKIDEYKEHLAKSKNYEYLIVWEDENFDTLMNKLKSKILKLYEQRNY